MCEIKKMIRYTIQTGNYNFNQNENNNLRQRE